MPNATNFRVIVNRTEERRVARLEDINGLCAELAGRPVFTADVIGDRGYDGPTLDLVVESGRATVFYLDIERGIKLASRNETRTLHGVISLRNDAYPELELDQLEVHYRDLVSPERAIAILRRYLTTGEVTDLVPWPPHDFEE